MKRVLSYIFLFSSLLLATEYHVDKDAKNSVIFISNAPVEQIIGKTENIDGYVLWQGRDKLENSEFYFEVDLASFDTGIGLRNRHMRENYLETEKYPYATFTGKLIKAESVKDTISVTASGVFELHGIKNPVEIDVSIVEANGGYFAKSRFEVRLEDYNIERPKMMLLKIGEIIRIELSFFVKEFKE